jgi:uncharacterized protein DUF2281
MGLWFSGGKVVQLVKEDCSIMATNLTKEIAEKAAMLPDDLQTEALRFVESLLAQQKNGRRENEPFESVKGILQGNYDRLDEEIGEMRREALKNFPRDIEP